MQARSSVRKSQILTAARRLLLECGYEKMTVEMMAKEARASVGSVTYFFRTKHAVAAAVAVEVIEAIAMEAKVALRSGGDKFEDSIRYLVTAALAWPKKFPGYGELAAYAMTRSMDGTRSIGRGLQPRLETILADWARPFISGRSIAALSSAELFALVLAPAMCGTSGPIARFTTAAAHDWAERVSAAAIGALQPAKQRVRKTASPPKGADHPDLFAAAAQGPSRRPE
jgi:AcrR family transcriptional regulator